MRTLVAVCVACTACWSASERTSSSRNANVVVRMANDDEFRQSRPPPMPSLNRRINTLRTGCDTSGTLATELYDPVVAFAREHLVEQEPGEIHASLSSGSKQSLSDGVNIVVEPRSIVGQLRVVLVGPPFYAPGQRWAETGYCLHVVQQSQSTTIVVKQSWSMIK